MADQDPWGVKSVQAISNDPWGTKSVQAAPTNEFDMSKVAGVGAAVPKSAPSVASTPRPDMQPMAWEDAAFHDEHPTGDYLTDKVIGPYAGMNAVTTGLRGMGRLTHVPTMVSGQVQQFRDMLPSYRMINGVPVPVPNTEALEHGHQQVEQIKQDPMSSVEELAGQAALLHGAAKGISKLPGVGESAPVNPADASRNLTKAVNPHTNEWPNYMQSVEGEAGRIQDFAQRNNLPMDTQLDFARAARGAAEESRAFYNQNILKPASSKVVTVPADSTVSRAGEGPQATLGSIDSRLSAINKELRAAYNQRNAGQTATALANEPALVAEQSALGDALNRGLAEYHNVSPDEISGIRQRFGRAYTVADQTEAAVNQRQSADGRAGEGRREVPLTVPGAIGTAYNAIIRGGPEGIANRNFRRALRDIPAQSGAFPDIQPNPQAAGVAAATDATNQRVGEVAAGRVSRADMQAQAQGLSPTQPPTVTAEPEQGVQLPYQIRAAARAQAAAEQAAAAAKAAAEHAQAAMTQQPSQLALPAETTPGVEQPMVGVKAENRPPDVYQPAAKTRIRPLQFANGEVLPPVSEGGATRVDTQGVAIPRPDDAMRPTLALPGKVEAPAQPNLPFNIAQKMRAEAQAAPPAPSVPVTATVEMPGTKPVAAPSVAAETPGELKPGDAGQMPVADLHTDPNRFQYKLGSDSKGSTNSLAGRSWEENNAGAISVWRDPADGKTYVVDGHNRYGKAVEAGRTHMSVKMIDAPDAESARAAGALSNISSGRGTPMDAAKFFRDSGYTPEMLAKKGISMTERMADKGIALSRLDPELFQDVVNGKLNEDRAAAIGSVTADPTAQHTLLDTIKKREANGATVTNEGIREFGRFADAPNITESEDTLFGPQETQRNTMLEMGEVSAYIQKQIANEKSLFKTVGNKATAERLGKAGNTIDAEKNADVSKQAAQAQELYNRLSAKSGPVNDALKQGAVDLAKAAGDQGAQNNVKQRAYERVRAALSQTLTGTD